MAANFRESSREFWRERMFIGHTLTIVNAILWEDGMLRRLLVGLLLVASILGPLGRDGRQKTFTAYAQTNSPIVTLSGAGSTFVTPLMSQWAARYHERSPEVVISYQAVGSGAGIEQFLARTVDFAASDAPLTDDQLARAGGPNAALHIPATMGALAISYNLPGLSHALNFTPDVIADIFLGKITSWDDARLSAINPDLALPTLAISVVHRSDGSGTTDVFTDYLSKVSSDWRTAVGRGTTVSWPVGAGGAGNDGVADGIKGSIGGIGYVELAYAQLNGLAVGTVQNSSGAFVEPSIASTAEAATVLSFGLPADLRYSITNAPGRDVYPIAGTTWFLVYADQPDPVKGQQLAQFLWWATHNGQALGADFSYAPLRPELVRRVEEQIFRLQCGGSACYSRGPLSPSA